MARDETEIAIPIWLLKRAIQCLARAESTYRACLEIALKMRAGLGDKLMSELAEIYREY